MINKKIGTLAAAILAASSAQAAFEVAFVAVDADGDTYVHNMGTYQNIDTLNDEGASDNRVNMTFSSEASFNSADYEWTVVGLSSTTNELVAAPPGGGSAVYADTGIVTLSASGATPTSSVVNHSSLGSEINGLQSWLTTVAGLAGASESVLIPASSSDKYTLGQQVAFHPGRMLDTVDGAYQLNTTFYSADTDPFATPAYNAGSVFGLTFDGTVAAVPVPAAAWLFGSALAGLTVVRRRK
jgi:hypothetical protein